MMNLTKPTSALVSRRSGRTASARRWLAGSLASALILAGAAVTGSAQKTAPPIWSGASAGYTIQWTGGDLAARPAALTSGASFSAREMARRDFAEIEKESDTHCEYDRTFKLLSVAGPIISYEDTYYLFCEGTAHPSGESRFVAVDLSKPAAAPRRQDETSLPGNAAKLTDYFPAGEILKALLADAVIQKALQDRRPQTLAELLKLIGDEFPTVAESEKLCFSLDPDLLTRFAFHHVEGNKVAVRLGLSGAGPCRNNLTQIGLLLTIPAPLKEALAKAEAGGEGFLMNRKIGAGRETKFDAETKKRPSRR